MENIMVIKTTPHIAFYLFISIFLAGCIVVTPEPPAQPSLTPLPTSVPSATLTPIQPEPTLVQTTSSPTTEAATPAPSTPTPESSAYPQPGNPATAQATLPQATATRSPYLIQPGSPLQVPAFSHADLGCNWMGVAGQVFDWHGAPQKNLVVNVGGIVNGDPINALAVTGGAPAYGPSGYEIKLADQPADSYQTIWIELFDQSGARLSARTYFDTSSDCKKNLILINFRQPVQSQVYLPILTR
jgi:hypothetical protein